MRIYIDSANMEEIKAIRDLGVLAGVTTNPTLVARQGGDYTRLIADICREVRKPVSAEVLSREWDSMVEEARTLAAISPQVVIKIPVTRDGLRAISVLKDEDIPTNATLVFSPNQALLAARAGASYVSPFIGRIDDNGNDGIQTLKEIIAIMDRYALDTEIIAASIRHPQHVAAAAGLGCHIATIPYQVILQMIEHPLTEAGIARFEKDWQQAFPGTSRSPGGKS